MIEIIKGKYKNISMRVNQDGNIIVKAPKKAKEELINKFISSHTKWIEKQLTKRKEEIERKGLFDIKNNVYRFGDKISYTTNQKEKLTFYQGLLNELQEISLQIKNKTGLDFISLKFTNSKRVWGSLDLNHNMKLNVKLIVLRKDLVEYVIIHELCHGVEFNHSKNFWKLVEQYCPNYKALRKELNNYSFLLTTDIIQ